MLDDDEDTVREGGPPLGAISMKPAGPARAKQPTPHVRRPLFRDAPAPRPAVLGVLAPPRPATTVRGARRGWLVALAVLIVVTAAVTWWSLP